MERFRLSQCFVPMSIYAQILDFGLRILDLRYSVCLLYGLS
ncbi:hypothetical protein D1AOALGA4SA_4349 [Olavius algarvensis Delta 1 endosymbiont]|nr:hypothetical protein D1AOALGA4SA_4349 [Olavius algarvensis Delta 1 endosymbiont]